MRHASASDDVIRTRHAAAALPRRRSTFGACAACLYGCLETRSCCWCASCRFNRAHSLDWPSERRLRASISTPQLFDKWREADAAARTAEKGVLAGSLETLDGKGAPPSIDDGERARRLRAAADAMLHTALAALRGSSERPSTRDREGRSRRPVLIELASAEMRRLSRIDPARLAVAERRPRTGQNSGIFVSFIKHSDRHELSNHVRLPRVPGR
jgi:hypothetical protein